MLKKNNTNNSLSHTNRNREFWCKGYYVDMVGKNTKAIKDISQTIKS